MYTREVQTTCYWTLLVVFPKAKGSQRFTPHLETFFQLPGVSDLSKTIARDPGATTFSVAPSGGPPLPAYHQQSPSLTPRTTPSLCPGPGQLGGADSESTASAGGSGHMGTAGGGLPTWPGEQGVSRRSPHPPWALQPQGHPRAESGLLCSSFSSPSCPSALLAQTGGWRRR